MKAAHVGGASLTHVVCALTHVVPAWAARVARCPPLLQRRDHDVDAECHQEDAEAGDDGAQWSAGALLVGERLDLQGEQEPEHEWQQHRVEDLDVDRDLHQVDLKITSSAPAMCASVYDA